MTITSYSTKFEDIEATPLFEPMRPTTAGIKGLHFFRRLGQKHYA